MSENFRPMAFGFVFACAFLIGPPHVDNDASAQNVGFCGNYQQTDSNAGDCPTCRLMIADNPEIQKYFVEANNGWSAELTWVEGDASVATGTGRWNDTVGHVYAGKTFDIDMESQGNTLTMAMTVSDGSIPGPVLASYRCLD